MIELPKAYSPDEQLDVENLSAYELLSRMKYFVETDDLKSAIRLANLLNGMPARLAKDWIRDTCTFLETRFLADLLLAHSTVTSIRSIY